MAEQHDASMMNNLYWWGVPTLFRCPQDDVAAADIALVGVPHSSGNGTTERDQHLGPRAVRNMSALQRRAHGGFGLILGPVPALLMPAMCRFHGPMTMRTASSRLPISTG